MVCISSCGLGAVRHPVLGLMLGLLLSGPLALPVAAAQAGDAAPPPDPPGAGDPEGGDAADGADGDDSAGGAAPDDDGADASDADDSADASDADDSADPSDADDLFRRYGFDGLLVSKFEDGLFGLCSIDLDGDGDGDLAVVNNAKARIELLLTRNAGEELPAEELELENELPDEAWFKRKSLPTEEKVWALALGDLDGDGRADAVFTGDSNKLTLAYAGPQQDYQRRVRLPLEDGVAIATSVRLGDLDRDGRLDIAVMTRDFTDLFLQDEDGHVRPGSRLPNATSDADGFALDDFDADGLLDLLYVASGSEWPLRVRLGQPGAGFGPEMRSRFAELRGWAVSDVDGDRAAEVVAIGRRSGRASLLGLTAQQDTLDELPFSALRHNPFGPLDEGGKRDVAVADLDRDGFPDVLVSEPGAARMVVSYGGAGGQFRVGESFPSLLGSRQPCLTDLDVDGLYDIVLGAPDENAVAVARVDAEGRLGFPETLGAPQGELLALGTGDTDADGEPEVWMVVAEGRGRTRTRTLRQLPPASSAAGPAAEVRTQPAPGSDAAAEGAGAASDEGDADDADDADDGVASAREAVAAARDAVASAGDAVAAAGAAPDDARSIALELPADPSDLLLVDLDRDGRDDLLIVVPTELPHVLLSRPDGLRPVDMKAPGLGLLKGVSRAALFHGDVDGDGLHELLVPGSNFARALVLAADGSAQVVAQYNLEQASAQVGAVAAAQLDAAGAPEVLLVDNSRSLLVVLSQDGGRLATRARVDLGGMHPLGLRPADVDRDGRADLLLWDADGFASVQVGGSDRRFVERHGYESPVKDAYLDSIAAGDVNGDGGFDLVFSETTHHLMHIVAVQQERLAHALKFPIFEARMFESSRRASREPREVLVADVTGDDLPDIAILVHDRLIVYPQQASP